MKNLFVSIRSVIDVSNNGNIESLVFEKGAIVNLYKTEKLGYNLFLVVNDELLNKPVIQKAISILNGEFTFNIINNAENVNDKEDALIEKIDSGLIVKNKQQAKSCSGWNEVFRFIRYSSRKVVHTRNTNETKIQIELNLDGNGSYNVSTGLNFFDHMVEQLSKHSLIDLNLKVDGDLHIDEHHTIEDTAIALGEAIAKALGNKRGIERYGFLLPMDDCLAQVAIDFGGRSWLVWDVAFKREYVGDVPTEMFYHFFKSFSDAAKCNLNVKAEGDNEHHKIESIFKAFAKSIKMAVAVNENSDALPTTKGVL
ncbi:MAG TPA: imidazoleglycerol-phosphate dehydratase HisB [Parafilimonas sp.]|nr:imidazoleglycerol-phosphate dehydratase HisB [Parafilimonas sp.]